MQMLFFKTQDGKVTEVLTSDDDGSYDMTTVDRWDMATFADAERIAAEANQLTDSKLCGKLYLPCDAGEWVSPRYDVVLAPRVGEPISYGIGSDSYPDGYITKIGGTDCSRIYTDTGHVYNRRRKSSAWIMRGGSRYLIRGHIKYLDPSF